MTAGIDRGLRPHQVIGYEAVPPNLLINGGFEIWQRGGGTFSTDLDFSADEWRLNVNTGAGDTLSVDRTTAPKFGTYAALMNYSRASFVAYCEQGVETWASLEGQWLTFSAWLYANTPNAVRLRIWDWTGASASEGSNFHTGTGWEHITVSKLIRSGLTSYSAWPHSFGIRVGMVFEQNITGARIDGAMLVPGKYPEGVPYIPRHPADDWESCYRFYQAGPDFSSGATWNGDVQTVTGDYWAGRDFLTPMYATPTVNVTGSSQDARFVAGPSAVNGITSNGFWTARTVSGSTGRGWFTDYFTAEVT